VGVTVGVSIFFGQSIAIDESNTFQLQFYNTKSKLLEPEVWAVCGHFTVLKETCAAQEAQEFACQITIS